MGIWFRGMSHPKKRLETIKEAISPGPVLMVGKEGGHTKEKDKILKNKGHTDVFGPHTP